MAAPLLQHRIKDVSNAIGPVIRPGSTVLMLMAAATGLAILILGMLVFVGRRPDPRIVATANRLRSRITY